MTKQELLKRIHEILWRNDDLMDQDALFELQDLIDDEILEEVSQGNMKIKRVGGYIINIEIN